MTTLDLNNTLQTVNCWTKRDIPSQDIAHQNIFTISISHSSNPLLTLQNYRTRICSKMPEPLKTSDVAAGKDPSVAKQFDTETPVDKQISDFFGVVDKLKVGLLTTQRQGLGPVSRSMAVARRTGPDFLFLANKNSTKFSVYPCFLMVVFF